MAIDRSSSEYFLNLNAKLDTAGISKQLKEISTKTTFPIKIDKESKKEIEGLKVETKKFKDELGKTVVVVTEFNKENKQLSQTIKSIEETLSKTEKTTKKVKSEVQQTTEKVQKATQTVKENTKTVVESNKNVKTLGQTFLETTEKVFRFGLSTAIIGGFTQAIRQGVEEVKVMDASLTELKKVTDLNGESLKSFTQDAFDLAEELHTTGSNVTDAVTEFSKSGFGLEDSKILAEQALKFKAIADEEISASEASTVLIQTMKAYNMTAQESVKIADAINEVSNTQAISSTGLSQAIGKVASSAQTANVDFEHLLGLITAANTTVQNASKVANDYKTILTNILTKDLENDFVKFGISVRDTNGMMKDGFTILEDLSEKFNSLGTTISENGEGVASLNDDMNKLLKDIAGSHNINTLVATLQNFDIAVEATETALGSAGSAQREYEKSLDSIKGKMETLHGQFQELVYGEGGLADLIKLALDGGTALLKFANSDVGGLIIKITLLSVAFNKIKSSEPFTFLASRFILFNKNIVNGRQLLSLFGIDLAKIGGTLKTLAPLLINPWVLGTGAILGFLAYVLNAKEKIGKLSKEIENVNNEITKLQEKRNNEGVTLAEQQRLEYLEKLNELQEKVYSQNTRKSLPTQASGYLTGEGSITPNGVPKVEKTTSPQVVKDTATAYEELAQKIRDYDDSSLKGIKNLQKMQRELEQLQAKLIEERDILAERKALGKGLTEEEEQQLARYEELIGVNEELAEKYTLVNDNSATTVAKLKSLSEELGISAEEIINNAEALEVSIEQYAEIRQASDELKDILNEMNSSYDILNSAVQEYNENGSLSASTLQSLLTLNPEYLALLEEENGQLKLNEQGVQGLRDAFIQQAQALIIQQGQAQISAIFNRDLQKTIDDVGQASNDVQSPLQQAGLQALQSGQNALTGSAYWREYWSAVNNKMEGWGTSKEMVDAINAVNAQVEERMKAVADIGNKLFTSSGGKGSSGASKAGKQAGDAYKEAFQKELNALKHDRAMELISDKEYYDKLAELNERYFGVASGQHEKYLDEYRKNEEEVYKGQKKLLEEQKDAYEKLFGYISDEFDKRIKKLQKERDFILGGEFGYGGLEGEKKALEKELDEWEEYYNNRIDKAEEAKDKEIQAEEDKLEALEKARDEAEKAWDDKINKVKEENAETEKNIRLQELLEARDRAKANKVKVFKDGKFQYTENTAEVERAEQELNQYQDELAYQERLDKLEAEKQADLEAKDTLIQQQKDYISKRKEYWDEEIKSLKEQLEAKKESYEEEIADLEQYIEDIKEQYDIQIQIQENNKEKWEEFNSAYKEEQEKRHTLDVIGLKKENEIFELRLENLRNFVNAYNSLLSELGNENETDLGIDYNGTIISDEPLAPPMTFASGVGSIKDDQVAVVGENPNKEVVIGSKLNNGTMMKLSRGSGVVNSNGTRTLAQMLNDGSFGSTTNYQRTQHSSVQNFNFDKIVLPNVSNVNSFVEELKNYKNLVVQSVNIK